MHRWFLFLLVIFCAGTFMLLTGCSDSGGGGTSGTMVTLYMYGRTPYTVPTSAEWAAFQDGNGAWQPINPTSAGVYTQTVTDPQGRFGFAFVSDGDLHLQHGTVTEGTTLICFLDNGLSFSREGGRQPEMPELPRILPGYYTIGGTIGYSGFTPGGTRATVDRQSTMSSPAGVYSVSVKAGLHDLVISDDTGSSLTTNTWMFLQRNIDVQNTMTFNPSVTADAIVNLEDGAALTVTGDTSGVRAYINYITANGTAAPLARNDDFTGSVPFNSMPAEAAAGADLYEAELSGSDWEEIACFASPAAMTMSVPTDDFNTFNVDSVTAEGLRYPVFEGLSYANGHGYFMYGATGNHFVDVIISAGWLAANDTTSYQVPNLSGVSGWQAEWSIPTAEEINDSDAQAYFGNITLARCIGRDSSPIGFPLADGEWFGIAYERAEK